jgi:hypothetical protein
VTLGFSVVPTAFYTPHFDRPLRHKFLGEKSAGSSGGQSGTACFTSSSGLKSCPHRASSRGHKRWKSAGIKYDEYGGWGMTDCRMLGAITVQTHAARQQQPTALTRSESYHCIFRECYTFFFRGFLLNDLCNLRRFGVVKKFATLGKYQVTIESEIDCLQRPLCQCLVFRFYQFLPQRIIQFIQ